MTPRTPISQTQAPQGRWNHLLALVLCVSTVILLFAGALVTSTGSSLAVPDWPLAYGKLFPPMVGGILYEHGHRLVAATVGLLTVAVAVWYWRHEPRPWVRLLAYAALGAVVVQGLLGGLTVIFLLPKAISISHALLAQIFFLLTVAMTQVTAAGWPELVARQPQAPQSRLTLWSGLTFATLLVELTIGAVVRHFNAAMAIPDFPLNLGGIVPPLTAFPIIIHYLHRVVAVVVMVLVGVVFWQVLRRHGGQPALRRPAVAMVVLTAAQIALGASIVLTLRQPFWTSLHLVNGGLLIAVSGVVVLRSLFLARPPGAAAARAVAAGMRQSA